MAISSFSSNISPPSFSFPTQNHHSNHHSSLSLPNFTINIISRHPHSPSTIFPSRPPIFKPLHSPITAIFSSGNGGGIGGDGGDGGGSGNGGDGEGESDDRDRNREEALMVLAEAGRPLEKLPADLAEAVKAGRVPGSIVRRFFELEKSNVFNWLLNFGGFRERLLADDLFLAKVAMECGVGIFTKVC